MHPHKAYQRAERALCAVATAGVGRISFGLTKKTVFSRALAAEAHLQVEEFLSLSQIESRPRYWIWGDLGGMYE